MVTNISKKIIKTKILILLSLFSVKPAIASNYYASSKVKITVKTATARGYSRVTTNAHSEVSNIDINNVLEDSDVIVNGSTSANDNFRITKITDEKIMSPYEIAILNE